MQSPRVASGVTLTRLDLSGRQAETDTWIKDAKGAEYSARFGMAYAAVESEGTLYVLCTEGVGWEVSDEDPLAIDIYAEKPGSLSIMPCAQMTQTPEEVRALMTGETVALEDFIRQFGARLEANYTLWANRLNPVRSARTSLSR